MPHAPARTGGWWCGLVSGEKSEEVVCRPQMVMAQRRAAIVVAEAAGTAAAVDAVTVAAATTTAIDVGALDIASILTISPAETDIEAGRS